MVIDLRDILWIVFDFSAGLMDRQVKK